MANEEAIQRKRERLAAEMHEYFWNVCPELTERWKQAMFTLSPSILQDLGVEVQHLEAVTNTANRYLHAAHVEAEAGDVPVEDLLDRALASMENLSEAADTMMRLLDELAEAALALSDFVSDPISTPSRGNWTVTLSR